jgi:hypothetical protein
MGGGMTSPSTLPGPDRIAAALDTLLIDGFDALALDTYRSVIETEHRAAALGYPELA